MGEFDQPDGSDFVAAPVELAEVSDSSETVRPEPLFGKQNVVDFALDGNPTEDFQKVGAIDTYHFDETTSSWKYNIKEEGTGTLHLDVDESLIYIEDLGIERSK